MSKVNKRISADLIDYGIVCVLFTIAGFIVFMIDGYYAIWDWYYPLLFVTMIIFLCKDIVKGQSIGKRFNKLKVVDKYGNTPNPFKLIIRNITVVIWPLEVYFTITEKKRLGDRLAGTDVMETL